MGLMPLRLEPVPVTDGAGHRDAHNALAACSVMNRLVRSAVS